MYMEEEGSDYKFLSLPEMYTRNVPIQKFEFAVDNDILEEVDRLPRDVYNVCVAQYRKNNNLQ